MTLVRYNNNNYAPKTFSSLLDKFFDDTVKEGKVYRFLPDVDLAESEKNYELHVAVPGLNKEDFHIEIQDKSLTVSGERKFVQEENNTLFKSVETKYGSFSRTFTLPENVNSEKIEAEYVNGILKIAIPKDETKKLKSTITVK